MRQNIPAIHRWCHSNFSEFSERHNPKANERRERYRIVEETASTVNQRRRQVGTVGPPDGVAAAAAAAAAAAGLLGRGRPAF
jgi:hypothetical protein